MEGKRTNPKENKSSSTPNLFLLNFNQIIRKKKYRTILSVIFIVSITSTIVLASIFIGSKKNYTECNFTVNNVSMSRYDAAINYILGGYNYDGGFSLIPFRQFYQLHGTLIMNSGFSTTYYTVTTLHRLNELNSCNISLIIDYYDKWLDHSDSSVVDVNEHGPRDLWLTYLVMKSLNATYVLSVDDFVTWTLDDYLSDGSFRPSANRSATISATKSAYLLLSAFESLDSINWTLSTQYILSQYLGESFFQHPDLPETLNIISTLDAYTYLSYTNQLGLINISTVQELIPYLTEMYRLIYDEFNLYEGFSHRVEPIHMFIQFSRENNISLTDFIPNIFELCVEIKNSQDKIYGGFPGFWDNYSTFPWVPDTVFALETLYECDLLYLMSENITIAQPPNTPYICKVDSPYTIPILSLTFVISIRLFKKKKVKIKSNYAR